MKMKHLKPSEEGDVVETKDQILALYLQARVEIS